MIIQLIMGLITYLKTWQTEIETGHRNTKVEEANDANITEVKETKNADEPKDETKYEQSKSENQQKTQRESIKSIAQKNKQIRYDWYKISIENDWMPDEYKSMIYKKYSYIIVGRKRGNPKIGPSNDGPVSFDNC